MWTKILIFMIIFFLVASPAMFKIVRKVLGAWVASADGLATPAGLALHGVVLVLLALYLPRVLMTYEEAKKTEEAEEYEGEEEYEEGEEYEGYASIEDRIAALEDTTQAPRKRRSRCPKCPKCRSKRSQSAPATAAVATGSAPPVTVATTSGSNPQAILAPGAVAAASPTPVVITPPAPSGATSPYFEWNY
jgi:hypothetical protein